MTPSKELIRLLNRLIKNSVLYRKPKNWDALSNEAFYKFGIFLQSEKEDWDVPRSYYIEYDYIERAKSLIVMEARDADK